MSFLALETGFLKEFRSCVVGHADELGLPIILVGTGYRFGLRHQPVGNGCRHRLTFHSHRRDIDRLFIHTDAGAGILPVKVYRHDQRGRKSQRCDPACVFGDSSHLCLLLA